MRDCALDLARDRRGREGPRSPRMCISFVSMYQWLLRGVHVGGMVKLSCGIGVVVRAVHICFDYMRGHGEA